MYAQFMNALSGPSGYLQMLVLTFRSNSGSHKSRVSCFMIFPTNNGLHVHAHTHMMSKKMAISSYGDLWSKGWLTLTTTSHWPLRSLSISTIILYTTAPMSRRNYVNTRNPLSPSITIMSARMPSLILRMIAV